MDEHLRFQFAVRIGYVDADLDGAGLVVEYRLNERDAAVELLARIGFRSDRDILSVSNPGQVRFVRVQMHPDEIQVGDGVDPIAGFHTLAFLLNLLDDDSAHGGVDRQVVGRLVLLLNVLNLFCGQPQQPEFLPRRAQKIDTSNVGRPPSLALILRSLDQFLLGRIKVLAVDVHHVVALADVDARVVDEQAIETARHPCSDVPQLGLIVVDLADHADFVRDIPPLNG